MTASPTFTPADQGPPERILWFWGVYAGNLLTMIAFRDRWRAAATDQRWSWIAEMQDALTWTKDDE